MDILIADWVALGIAILFAVIGLAVGFGKGIKFLTSGIIGVAIIFALTVILYGYVVEIPIIKEWLDFAITWLKDLDNVAVNFLLTIHLEVILTYALLYLVIWLVKLLAVSILKGIFEIDNGFFKAINKLFGLVLMVAFAALLALVVFSVADLIGGDFNEFFVGENGCLVNSAFKLDWVYQNNPLNVLIASFT